MSWSCKRRIKGPLTTFAWSFLGSWMGRTNPWPYPNFNQEASGGQKACAWSWWKGLLCWRWASPRNGSA